VLGFPPKLTLDFARIDRVPAVVPETVDQYGKDVSAFLMWAAEPKLEARKSLGFQVILYLIILAGMMFFVTKKVWSGVDH